MPTSTPPRSGSPARAGRGPTTTPIDEWARDGFDFVRGEQAADDARALAARLIGADPADVALIPSVSSAAGLVAAQFGPPRRGENVVIGEREYSSNHFPWRQLADKGYDVRQVPFRNGGLEPDDVARARRRRHAAGRLQRRADSDRAPVRHRRDQRARARGRARSCSSTARSWSGRSRWPHDLPHVDVLAAPDHKFLLNAGRGMGYCYLSPRRAGAVHADQRRLAGGRRSRSTASSARRWTSRPRRRGSTAPSAGSPRSATRPRSPSSTTSGPTPSTPATASSTRAAAGRARRRRAGTPVDLPEQNRSTIVSVPLGDREPAPLLARAVRAGRRLLGTRRQPAALGPLLQPRGRHRPARRGPRVAGTATRERGSRLTPAISRRTARVHAPSSRVRGVTGAR